MRFLIQRVSSAKVEIEGRVSGSIEIGYLVFIGIEENDTEEIAQKMIKKLIGLRIFEDKNGKTNLCLEDVNGSLLLVSQFTLYANCKKGNRPSFIGAGGYEISRNLYEYIIKKCEESMPGKVFTGEFGADMKVYLLNDGPFTIWLDSKDII